MTKRLIFLLITLSASAALFFSCGESPAEQYNDHSKSNPESTTLTTGPQSDSDTKSRQHHKKNAEDKLVDWLSGFVDVRATDILIVIFTAVLATKTSGLYRETSAMRQLADQQRCDAFRSVKATEIAATAALKSADVSERTLAVLERPWILVKIYVGLLRPTDRPTSWWHVKFVICNYGRMPAIVNSVESGWTQGAEPEFPFLNLDHVIMLGPSDTEPVEINIPEGWEVTDYGRPTIPELLDWFFNVKITYSDVGGNEYVSFFCWRYEPSSNGWVRHGDNYNYLT
jgi:hypothetical protein